VNNQKTTISSSTTKQQPIQKIFQRLPPYADYTGSYISEIFDVKFICRYYCHMKSKDLKMLSQSVKADRSNRQAVSRHLTEVDKKGMEAYGHHGFSQRQTLAASSSTLGEDTNEIQ
jgi:hypothetical protein